MDRSFVAPAPNRCWVADFTHVATFAGVVYVAFVVDTFSRRIVGWSAATSKETRLHEIVWRGCSRGFWSVSPPSTATSPEVRCRRAAHSPPNRYRTAVWVRCRTKASVSAAGVANSGP
ncbi:DDE-type integrase/transposase/recombinase [Streptomyces bottropensis]|uniref:DDE-type integrase/transposase/recombinase n=1 Tax=Streptomyces bottropensis TaxID=42235 RepID=UPI003684BD66